MCKQDKRDTTISWLESNQMNGAFEGFPEHEADFSKLTDEDIEWYYTNWVLSDTEEEDVTPDYKEETVYRLTKEDFYAVGEEEGYTREQVEKALQENQSFAIDDWSDYVRGFLNYQIKYKD